MRHTGARVLVDLRPRRVVVLLEEPEGTYADAYLPHERTCPNHRATRPEPDPRTPE
jgi:hypothetical protein